MNTTLQVHKHLTVFSFHKPNYDYHDVRHAFPAGKDEVAANTLDQCKRVALAVLPFASFYKPLSVPLSLLTEAGRTFICLQRAAASLEKGNSKEIAYAVFQTAIAASTLVGTAVAHPLGMLVSTGQDLIIDITDLLKLWQNEDHEKTQTKCFNIINNALYLSLFLQGGLPLTIASLAMQIITELHHSVEEFNKEHYIESVGHSLMSIARGVLVTSAIKTSLHVPSEDEMHFPSENAIITYLKKHELTRNDPHGAEKGIIEKVAKSFANQIKPELEISKNILLALDKLNLPKETLVGISINLTKALTDCANSRPLFEHFEGNAVIYHIPPPPKKPWEDRIFCLIVPTITLKRSPPSK